MADDDHDDDDDHDAELSCVPDLTLLEIYRSEQKDSP